MPDSSHGTVFDATRYSEYRRPKGFRRAGLLPRHYLEAFFGLGFTGAVIVFYVLSAEQDFDLRLFAAFVGLFVFFALALILSYFYLDVYGPPVRLYSNGTLEIGRKRLPMTSVSEIVVEGRTGPVTFRSESGKELACVSKTQVVNVQDFVAIVRKEHPHVTVRTEALPVKVRLAKDETI